MPFSTLHDVQCQLSTLLDPSFATQWCTGNPQQCLDASPLHGACPVQTVIDPLHVDADPLGSSEYHITSDTHGAYPWDLPFSNSTLFFPNFDARDSAQSLAFGDLAFLTTPETTGPKPIITLPRDFAINQALNEQSFESGVGQTGVTFPASPTSSPSPSSTSSQSTTIRCSWPACEKEFKNRSDYKYAKLTPPIPSPLN